MIGEDGFKAAQAGPAEVGDAGEVAEDDGGAEGDGGAEAAEPVHLAGEREGADAQAGAGMEWGGHGSIFT